jgi:hypothetical protein
MCAPSLALTDDICIHDVVQARNLPVKYVRYRSSVSDSSPVKYVQYRSSVSDSSRIFRQIASGDDRVRIARDVSSESVSAESLYRSIRLHVHFSQDLDTELKPLEQRLLQTVVRRAVHGISQILSGTPYFTEYHRSSQVSLIVRFYRCPLTKSLYGIGSEKKPELCTEYHRSFYMQVGLISTGALKGQSLFILCSSLFRTLGYKRRFLSSPIYHVCIYGRPITPGSDRLFK